MFLQRLAVRLREPYWRLLRKRPLHRLCRTCRKRGLCFDLNRLCLRMHSATARFEPPFLGLCLGRVLRLGLFPRHLGLEEEKDCVSVAA